MPAISFSVFREKIENGTKRQTIRLARKRPIKVGDKLYLYWKMRTKECRPLLINGKAEALTCKATVRLPWVWILIEGSRFWLPDGFESDKEFRAFFEQHYHPKPDTLLDVIRW